MPRATIADIARKAGVSRSAVSIALNGQKGVSGATRDRILAVAASEEWQPHSAARSLRSRHVGVMGLVLARDPRVLGDEPFFWQLAAGLQSALSVRSVALQMMVEPDVDAEARRYRQWAAEHRVDGVVLLDARLDDPRPPLLRHLGMPFVVVRHEHPCSCRPDDRCGYADDRASVRLLLHHLTELGHQRMGHVAGFTYLRHTRARADALREGAAAMGLPAIRTVTTDFSAERGAAATRELLKAPEPPTAIVFDSDVMAAAGSAAAVEAGVDVPAQVSIVSFDDSLLTRLAYPPITALVRDTFARGQALAEALYDVVHRDTASRSSLMAMASGPAPVLAVRASTAPPASA